MGFSMSQYEEIRCISWETELYTPPVLRGAAFFDIPAPAVYKIQGP